jgi:hypothetical protein
MQNHGAKTGGWSRFRFDRLEERIAPGAVASAIASASMVSTPGNNQASTYYASTSIVTDAEGNIISYTSQQGGS